MIIEGYRERKWTKKSEKEYGAFAAFLLLFFYLM